MSRALVRKYHTLGIETLNVSGMIRAGQQSKALADAGMSSLLHQIRYKAQLVRYTAWWKPASGFPAARPAPSAER